MKKLFAIVISTLLMGCGGSQEAKDPPVANRFVICFSGGQIIYQNTVLDVYVTQTGRTELVESNGRKLWISAECIAYYG